jgi:hypothetical protein
MFWKLTKYFMVPTVMIAVGLIVLTAYAQPPRPKELKEMNRERGSDGRSSLRDDDNGQSLFPLGTVIFHGGYATDPRDGGRPVILIASALGVKAEVFRDAFSGVTPARGAGPSPAQAQANKKVLMSALSKYGVTNEYLDTVSNHYRYRPQAGELWKHRDAKAIAVIDQGKVIDIKIIDNGAGYSSTPSIEVVGYPGAKAEAVVEFNKDLRTNGQIKSIRLTNVRESGE